LPFWMEMSSCASGIGRSISSSSCFDIGTSTFDLSIGSINERSIFSFVFFYFLSMN
jgi:hypothetical protein